MAPFVLPLIEFGTSLIDKFIPDPQAKAKAQVELMQQAQAGEFKEIEAALQIAANQTSINVEEAKNPSLFVSGWRPATGWACVIGLVYSFLIQPLLAWLTPMLSDNVCTSTIIDNCTKPPPELDIGTLLVLLGGMLGLGTLRTKEKLEGVARE